VPEVELGMLCSAEGGDGLEDDVEGDEDRVETVDGKRRGGRTEFWTDEGGSVTEVTAAKGKLFS
jgi:hypothetical protein